MTGQTIPIGWIDNSFGINGSDTINDVIPDLLSVFKGDSLISVGAAAIGGVIVAKFDNNGYPCANFGTNGSLHFNIPGYGNSFTQSATVQPDGRILIAGYGIGDTTLNDFLIVRLMPDGSFDTSFNKTGILAADFDQLDNDLWNIGLQPDGKILACGTTSTDTGLRLELVRFRNNGAIDSTFGTAGRAGLILGGNSGPMYMARQPDGKIVVGGGWGGASNAVSVLMRFDSTGTLDSTFGIHGQNITPTPNTWIFSLQLLPSGKFLTSDGIGFARYNANGNPDSTFGTNGVVNPNVALTNVSVPCSVAPTPDGKTVYTITEEVGGVAKEILARFNSDGSPDTTFGTEGIIVNLVPEIKTYKNYVDAVQVQSSGKIVTSGFVQTHIGDGLGVLTRYFQTSTGVPSITGNFDQLTLYPNPAQHDVTIVSSILRGNVLLHILDMNGKIVQSQDLQFQNGSVSFHTDIAPGVYGLQLSDEIGQLKTAKLVIER